jgi:hypothetical protein
MSSHTSLQYSSSGGIANISTTTDPPHKRLKLDHAMSHTSLGNPSLSYHDFAAHYDSRSTLHTSSTMDLGVLRKEDSLGMMRKDGDDEDDENDQNDPISSTAVRQATVQPTALPNESAKPTHPTTANVATTNSVSSSDSLRDLSAHRPQHPQNTTRLPVSSSTTTVTSGSNSPLSAGPVSAQAPPSPLLPLKATKMSHLRQKYMQELEYMLCEFQKLERQLLGAKATTAESAGSRERREKLHSFITHLSDTIQNIQTGCQLESEGKSTVGEASKQDIAQEAALADLTCEKGEEENVQKLEEHILANLLPVKVRLKKQLAAQQGAKHNPAGMPVAQRGLVAPSEGGKGTFAAAAEERRKQLADAAAAAQGFDHAHVPAEPVHPDQTQFGKPLQGNGSSLTRNLHGSTLGSAIKVGTDKSKILFAGLAIGSSQVKSSVNAASSVHQLVIKDPALLELARQQSASKQQEDLPPQTQQEDSPTQSKPNSLLPPSSSEPNDSPEDTNRKAISLKVSPAVASAAALAASEQPDAVLSKSPPSRLDDVDATYPDMPSAALTDEERRTLRRLKRRKKRRKRKAEATPVTAAATAAPVINRHHKPTTKKRGPRTVEYMCALCNEVYNSTCDYNPWWALAQHDCPKCRKNQIPRVDISAPANTIEYHPALLAHADENGGSTPTPPAAIVKPVTTVSAPVTSVPKCGNDSDSFGSDLSDDDLDGLLSDTDSEGSGEIGMERIDALSPAEQAENEYFGVEYKGPKLKDSEAARLLILMGHASTCPCKHQSIKHRETCRNTKWMMLHVRDCPGTTSSFDVCPFPWCRKVKHLLYHLVSCRDAKHCEICSPTKLNQNMILLKGLNQHRFMQYRERLIGRGKALTKVSNSAPKNTPAQAQHKSVS